MATKSVQIPNHTWFKAKLSPMAKSLFTDSFYPEPCHNGSQHVYFAHVDSAPRSQKVITVSKLCEAGIRMMTLNLANMCLIPLDRASTEETLNLNTLTCKLKL